MTNTYVFTVQKSCSWVIFFCLLIRNGDFLLKYHVRPIFVSFVLKNLFLLLLSFCLCARTEFWKVLERLLKRKNDPEFSLHSAESSTRRRDEEEADEGGPYRLWLFSLCTHGTLKLFENCSLLDSLSLISRLFALMKSLMFRRVSPTIWVKPNIKRWEETFDVLPLLYCSTFSCTATQTQVSWTTFS